MAQSLVLALDLDQQAGSIQATTDAALRAQSAGIHAVSFARGILDPVQRAAYVGAATHSIGLLTALDALYAEPFHTAAQLASLDTISGGRAGWILQAKNTAEQAAAVGRTVLPEEQLSQEAADVVTAHRKLWDSWQDDAVIRDQATGRYLDADRVHYADFTGDRFSIKGPSIIPRPPQGQLPIIAPEHLFGEEGLRHCRLAGADAVAVSSPDLSTLLRRAATASKGGAVVLELEIFLDHAGQSGQERAAQAAPSGLARFAGSAQDLVRLFAEIHQATANPADQRRHIIHLHPGALDIELEELGAQVIPQANREGLLAPSAQGSLRQSLALPTARNRFQEAS